MSNAQHPAHRRNAAQKDPAGFVLASVGEMRAELRGGMAELRKEIVDARVELQQSVKELREEYKSGTGKVRAAVITVNGVQLKTLKGRDGENADELKILNRLYQLFLSRFKDLEKRVTHTTY